MTKWGSRMKTMLAVVGLVCLYDLSHAEGVNVFFDNPNSPQKVEEAVMPRMVDEFQPKLEEKAENFAERTLSDLVGKCPTEIQAEFYRSLFFVNGRLASMNRGIIEKCIQKENKGASSTTFRTSENTEYKKYDCLCNSSNQYRCKKTEEDTICDTTTCWGSCSLFGKQTPAHVDVGELFTGVPDNIAREFIGGIILKNGQVERILLSRNILESYGADNVTRTLKSLMGQ